MKKPAINKKALISVLVYSHNEGRLLHHTLKSIYRARSEAEKHDFGVEIIIIADSPSDQTAGYLKEFVTNIPNRQKVEHTDFNDPGKAFNAGINKSAGNFITTIEGGYLLSGNWLLSAAQELITSTELCIVHPACEFSFGDKDRLWEHTGTLTKDYVQYASVEVDLFGTVMMTTSELARAHPYMNAAKNFIENAWHWNCQTLAAGISHRFAPKTLYARRYDFVSEAQLNRTPLLPPTDFLLPTGNNEALLMLSNENMPESPPNNRINTFLDKLRKFIDYCYRSYISKKIRQRSHRLDLYVTSLRNETLHFMRPIMPKQANSIPKWIEHEISSLHDIDYRLFLSEHLKEIIELYSPVAGVFARSYWYLANRINTECDYLIVVPYLKNGGAEREIAIMIDAVLNKDPTKKITVLATDQSDSPGIRLIDSRVNFIRADQSFHSLDDEQKGRLIAYLCMQLQPKKLHIINSVPGYIALQRHAGKISIQTKIYITIFMIDRTPEGRKTHMFTERMVDAIDYVEAVFTDNKTVVAQLVELMAIDSKKFIVLYQPTNLERINATKQNIEHHFNSLPIRILWASRIDRQKRADILVGLADLAKERNAPVEFHVYGSQALDDGNHIDIIKNCNNLVYHGEFNGGLKTLPTERFDIFLLTSEWEGMPNVILEAIAESLLVIAPNVGGVSETIQDGQNGYLINDFSDVSAYLEAILRSAKEPERSRQLISNAQSLILKRHSHEGYIKQLEVENKYIN